MGVTLTDVLLFGKAQLADVDKATLVIYRRNILRWSALGGYLDIIVKGVSPLSLPDAIANSLSYVKAFGGTEQRDIPDNYLQRQFIYMMDGSYLLTDLVPTYDGHYEMDFQTTSFTSYASFLGGRSQTNQGAGLNFGYVNNVWVVDGFTTGSRYTSSVAPVTNTRYKFIFNNQVATLTSGNSTLFTNTFTGTESNSRALAINGFNNKGSVVNNNSGIYLYSFKAWNAQGELIADYVPAVQKGTVPVVGFYDTVSKTFKTATAGTFAAGGEAVPTPDYPMDIVCNNGVLKARHQSGLPLGYTLLETISSTQGGGEYIDTGILFDPTKNYRVVGSFINPDATLRKVILGNYYSMQAETYYSIELYSDGKFRNYMSDDGGSAFNIYSPTAVPADTIAYFDTSYNALTHQTTTTLRYGTTEQTYSGATPDTTTVAVHTLKLFNDKRSLSPVYNNPVSIGAVQIYIDGALEHNYIPAQYGNTVGMYDTVTGEFKTSPVGTLVAGNAVSDPVEIYTDGTVETLGIICNNLVEGGLKANINSSGQVVSNNSFAWYAPVTPGETYTYKNPVLYAFFTEKPQIGSVSYNNSRTVTPVGTFTVPNDPSIKYIGFRNNSDGGYCVKGSVLYAGGTATCEDLLSIGTYTDEQEVISGGVTRKVGVKVLDGTEYWNKSIQRAGLFFSKLAFPGITSGNVLCTHMPYSSTLEKGYVYNSNGELNFWTNFDNYSLNDWQQWLADQYAAGTPVIIVYPLATPTTESVTGQTLQVQEGNNILEITQASLNGLELEAEYQAAVSLTIQEVQDANLDPNVEVTIN